MGLSQLQFDAQYPAEDDVTDLLDQELWVYDNFKVSAAVAGQFLERFMRKTQVCLE